MYLTRELFLFRGCDMAPAIQPAWAKIWSMRSSRTRRAYFGWASRAVWIDTIARRAATLITHWKVKVTATYSPSPRITQACFGLARRVKDSRASTEQQA